MVPESVWPIVVREHTDALIESSEAMRRLSAAGVIPFYDDTPATAHQNCCLTVATSPPLGDGASDAELTESQSNATRQLPVLRLGRPCDGTSIRALYSLYNASLTGLSRAATECQDLEAESLGQKYHQWMQDASAQCGILATRLAASGVASRAFTSSVAALVQHFATTSLALTNRAPTMTQAMLMESCRVYAQQARELEALVSQCEGYQVTRSGAFACTASLSHASELVRDMSTMAQVSAWHNWAREVHVQ